MPENRRVGLNVLRSAFISNAKTPKQMQITVANTTRKSRFFIIVLTSSDSVWNGC